MSFHNFTVYPFNTAIRFAVGNGSFPLKVIPLKQNGTVTEPGAQPGAVPSSCNQVVTPACLQALYGLPTALATQSSNRIAVAGFLNQWAQQADLSVRYYNLFAVLDFN